MTIMNQVNNKILFSCRLKKLELQLSQEVTQK